MRYIMSQTTTTKFRWQLKIAIGNLLSLDVPKEDIFVVLIEAPDGDPDTEKDIRSLGVNVETYKFPSSFTRYGYIPMVKPYGLYKYFSGHPEDVPYTYMYQDSDVIYRELIDESTLSVDATHWTGSDTASYVGLDYIKSKGEDLPQKMADACDIDVSIIENIGENAPGAQIIMNSPDPEWFKDSYEYCQKLYKELADLEPIYKEKYKLEGNPDEYPIQKWAAQMWTDLWFPAQGGITWSIDHQLDFCFATDTKERMDTLKIYHDAGVTADDKTHFYKGGYEHSEPFGEDFSFVDPDSAQQLYIDAMEFDV